MVLKVEMTGFMMKVFAPNRKITPVRRWVGVNY